MLKAGYGDLENIMLRLGVDIPSLPTYHYPHSGHQPLPEDPGTESRRLEITQGVKMGRRSVIGVEVVVGDTKVGNAVLVTEGSLRI
jgi:hypothetical protein